MRKPGWQDAPLGATYLGGGRCRFCVWAPLARKVEARIVSPRERVIPLEPGERGYHQGTAEGVEPGSLYFLRLDGEKERPDPASRCQPRGVHQPSQVADPEFPWKDDGWPGLPLREYILYELHVGTFTAGGTFEAVIPHLDGLKELGVTALELMPVSQFPGSRNWGYDGVHPFAVQDSYGGPQGLKRLVDACHRKGLAVVLDVVYNHLGPEGNYLMEFGPYFTDLYRTPWGWAVNFDGPHSDEVRRYFTENALYWITEYHLDGLRLDALHAIMDLSARPFLRDMAAAFHARGEELHRKVYLFAESDRNDSRFIRGPETGGLGLDAHWNDDFHHALHTLLTGEKEGYYLDFGRVGDLKKAFDQGFVYSGGYSPHRRRSHGSSSSDLPAWRLVVFSQNHDQVGNRMMGERLSRLVSPEGLKLAAAAVLLSPNIPLLFMGEEYGETAPFPYFISHSDPDLVEAVRRGRREEFSSFAWKGELPDPQDEATYRMARLNRGLASAGTHRALLEFYRELIGLRRALSPLSNLSKEEMEALAWEKAGVLLVRRWKGEEEVFLVFNFKDSPAALSAPVPPGRWAKKLDSAEERWEGPGSSLPGQVVSDGEAALSLSPRSFALFSRTEETP